MARRATLVVLLATIVSIAAPSVASFGFELSEWSGRPGDRIDVEGSGLLTCCPTDTPTEASLVVWVDPDRPSSEIALFEGVAADASGNFSTSFSVPPLPAGEYDLRFCSTAPESLFAGGGQRTCVPAQRSFTIFEPVSFLWPALAAMLLVVLLVLILLSQRRRRRLDVETIGLTGTSTDPTDPTDQIETLSGRPIGSARR
jgi:hypothetical protein